MVARAATMENQELLDKPVNIAGDKKKRSQARRVGGLFWSLCLILLFIAGGTFLGGLARYISVVTKPTTPVFISADGIIVLTGGKNRIRAGLHLLEEGKGKRLLITGVNPAISDQSIHRIANIDDAWFGCCVDIDRTALDTIGNALAAKKWTDTHKIQSAIIVTGALHMPRALRELSHALGPVKLIAASVNVPSDKTWWHDSRRVRDLLREYSKLAVVTVRDGLNALMGWPWPTMPMRDALSKARV